MPPTVQTIIFETIDIDVQSNKQVCVHPIHRCLAQGNFPINFDFGVLTSAYDLPPGSYTCKHTLYSGRTEIVSLTHKPVVLDQNGSVAFRTNFDNVMIPKPGRYDLYTEIGKYKGSPIPLTFEAASERMVRKTAPKR